MKNTKVQYNAKHDKKFFEDVAPTKLTEAKQVKLHTKGWGILSDYYLESAKITKLNTGEVCSTATLKIGDQSGQVACLVRESTVGLLFGMSPQDWAEVEKLCKHRDQLFYRYFKNGLSPSFGLEQRLFYNFCMNNQIANPLVAVFKRGVNMRKKDPNDAFLEILELRKCDRHTLNIYTNYLRNNSEP